MAITKKREVREDAEGVSRLAAAPGDEKPARDITALGPPRVSMAPQQYDDETGEFSPGPGEEAGD